MSIDLQGSNTFPIVKTITVYQTATEVLLPTNARHLQIGAQTHKLFYSTSGTDGAILGADKDFIAKEAKQVLNLGRGRNKHDSIFISTQTAASATVTLVFSEE